MRWPHPRFDHSRNAWVTRAGGKLKILAKGPKTADTEQAAWDAFYAHMAALGNPVPTAASPITLGELADEFGAFLNREVEAGRTRPATRAYYTRHIQQFLDAAGGRRPAADIKPLDLDRFKSGWHSVQAIQRLFNFGVSMDLLDRNPVRSVKAPALGRRERVLSRGELDQLLRAARPHYRVVLLAMRYTIARPQEIRALRWRHLVLEPVPMFVLRDFKARSRRTDAPDAYRLIPLDDRMLRLLGRLSARGPAGPDDHVFLNSKGRPWSGNALRIAMRNLRRRLGWGADENGERVVNYTLRHMAATRACAAGLRDTLLAELMGRSQTRTTARYLHPQGEHLHEAIRRATGMSSSNATSRPASGRGAATAAGPAVSSAGRSGAAGEMPPSRPGGCGTTAGAGRPTS